MAGGSHELDVLKKHEGAATMLIVHVYVRVKVGFFEAFKEATSQNAVQSLCEPGIVRFDVIQQLEDQSRFVLVEVYRTAEAALEHKNTPHYAIWRDAVAEMMAEPRTSIRYSEVFPCAEDW
jgi:(4S)-4-hydroxy-5-phosphonooxypentane-2,3-dione isomerase